MENLIPTCSVSTCVHQWLDNDCLEGKVLAVFERVCNIAITWQGSGRREVIALVAPEIGDGPLNIVLRYPMDFGCLAHNADVIVGRGGISVGSFRFDIQGASLWIAAPVWQQVRDYIDNPLAHIAIISGAALQLTLPGSLLELTEENSLSNTLSAELRATVLAAMDCLADGWQQLSAQQSLLQWCEGARQLAGLGRGLTPSGDDFLMGLMLAIWLLDDDPGAKCLPLVETAESCTTQLSAALLRRAAYGECGANWHDLLQSLSSSLVNPEQRGGQMMDSLRAVLAHGHTSGADTLAGFLWMCRVIRRTVTR